jgi:hypothetical protein
MNSGRQSDYLVTIFSRHKGKTRSFYLSRRFLFLTLGLLLLLVVSLFFSGQAFFQEREERQRLQERVALLDQMVGEFEEGSKKQGGPLPEIKVEPAVEPEEEAEPVREKKRCGRRAPRIRSPQHYLNSNRSTSTAVPCQDR